MGAKCVEQNLANRHGTKHWEIVTDAVCDIFNAFISVGKVPSCRNPNREPEPFIHQNDTAQAPQHWSEIGLPKTGISLPDIGSIRYHNKI
jgi:hypothetical protein